MQNLNRTILSLALPALGALIAEPLFLLIDSAFVATIGTDALAGLALASTIITTVVGLCIFLAYITTAQVGRLLGGGNRAGAFDVALANLWLAAGLGLLITVATSFWAPQLVGALGGQDAVADQAVTYLRWALPGIPGMLVVLAATGALRGMQNTKTPLYVASIGAVANVGLNAVLVLWLQLGIAGSGAGTAAIQLLMGGYLAWLVLRMARAERASLRPRLGGIGSALRSAVPLLVRTLTLRMAMLLTVWAATGLGEVPLASHQIVNSVWGLTALGLDAIAIAAQALVSQAAGAGDRTFIRDAVRKMTRWGAGSGAVLALLTAATAWWLPRLFGSDTAVHGTATAGLLVSAVFLPIAGIVFVLDGVLIGAGDNNYLAYTGVLTLLVYVPAVLAVVWLSPFPDDAAGLAALWLAFSGVFISARALANWLRARTDAWH